MRYHEPRKAWASGPTGMEAYERIIPESAALLGSRRYLVLELGYGQEKAVRGLIRESGSWAKPHVLADLSNIPRVLSVCRERHL